MSHRIHWLLVAYITGLSLNPALANTPPREAVSSTQLLSEHPQTVRSAYLAMVAQASPPTPSNSGNSEDGAILKIGSRGARVSELQDLLKRLGYYDEDPDGIFGEQTKAAVIEFQQQNNLPVDGQVGSTTLVRLQEALVASRSRQPASESGTDFPEQSVSNPTAPPEEASPAVTAAPTSTDQNRFWWMAILIATSAIAGFAVYKYSRPRIKRFAPAKSSIATSETRAPERSPSVESDSRVSPMQAANPTQVMAASTHTPAQPSSSTGSSTSSSTGTHPSEPTTLYAEISPVSETTRLAKVDIVDELIDDLHSPDPVKRRKAIWELGQAGNSKAVQPLVDLMMDSDSSQRSLILAAISEIGVRTLKPMNRALLLSLQDHSSDVRKNAIRDVTRVYDLISQMSELLAHAASDPDVEVQETAQWALGQLGRIRGVPEMGNGVSLPNKTPEHLPGDV